jgi:phosphoesterase RecJ-like protein
MLSAALARARLHADAVAGRGLVWTTVLQDDLRAAGLDLEDADVVMGTLRRTAEADVAVLVKEAEDGTFRVSTRSRGATDVGAACGALGGGGHRLAAGFTSRTDPDTTIETLRLLLDAQQA